jgi:leader peptidase (prepilin peptidase)/N-methyltransferase
MEFVALPEWMWLVSAFLFGLVFGSFGNVVIWRLPRGESLSTPASHCPRCDTPIQWHDNIPVLSWFLLGGRCRSCGAPISARYPLVELASGVLWVLAAWRFGLSWGAPFAILLFYVLLLLAFIDWDTMRLPNSLVLLLFLIGVLGVAVSQVVGLRVVPLLPSGTGFWSQPAYSALLGAVLPSALTLAISLAYSAIRGGQGYGTGDVKLIVTLGLYLGLYSLMTLFFATVIGAVYGVVSASRAGEGGRHRFPFGPFIALAAVLVTLVGPQIWSVYEGLLHVRV